MRIPIYQVDAFTQEVFKGNPAAVCPLDDWLDDHTLQAIAEENRLSETAFFVREGDRFRIRWFTPSSEVPLCGHATLASVYVITQLLGQGSQHLAMDSASGELNAELHDDGSIALDLPAYPPLPADTPEGLAAALGAEPQTVLRSNYLYVILEDETRVAELDPDLRALASLDPIGVCVTAQGEEVDFVSRFFAPAVGVDEDPVTGSAHCGLTPLWSSRLNRTRLRARQLSARGGELGCELQGDRVFLRGHCIQYLEGVIIL